MVTRYGQADVPREVSGWGGPVVRPAAADFPRDVCLTVSRNHAVFLDLDLDLDLVSNRQTSSVEYHADGGSAARYGESFASRCLKLSADGQLTASAGRRFQSGIVRG